MNQWSSQPGRQMLEGSFRNLLAEALFPLTALVTAGFLTRQLGVEGYGVLVLAVTLVSWIQWSLNAVFSRATIKYVSEAADWRPVGTAAVNLQLFAGSGAMLLLWVFAIPLGWLFGEPNLAWYLSLLAIDIPLSCVVQAHRHILNGVGRFGRCGMLSAGRWTVRMVLIVVFVLLGWSITGAILGMIGASLAELLLARRAIRPALFRRVAWNEWPLWDYAMPLFISSACGTLFIRLDLLSLKALGGSGVQAGLYGAAQNLSLLPSLLGAVVAPILLATVSRVLSGIDAPHAGELARNAMRGSLLLLPLGALIAGTAGPLAILIFGEPFAAIALILACLVIGGFVMLLMTVCLTLMIAFGYPRLLVLVTGPLVPLALVGHILAVPRWGAAGAAAVTGCLSVMAAVAAAVLSVRVCGLAFPWDSFWRALLGAGLAFGYAIFWPALGLWVLVKLAIGSLLLVFFYWVIGEFSAEEIAVGHNLLHMPLIPRRRPAESRP